MLKEFRRDWLCAFQNVNPADGCCVAIGFLSSSGTLGHFRLNDDDATASIQKERRKTGKYISWREQWKLNINSQIYMNWIAYVAASLTIDLNLVLPDNA